MERIAVVINGDLNNERQGQINSSLLRARYLKKKSVFEVDVFCVREFDSFFVRKIKKTSKIQFLKFQMVDGMKISFVYKPRTLIDIFFEKILRKESISSYFFWRKMSKILGCYSLISGHSYVGGMVAYEVNKICGIPYSVTWHGSDIHTNPLISETYKSNVEKVIKKSSSNVFVSLALLNFGMSIFKNIPSPHVLYNAPSDKFYKYNSSKRNILRDRYFVSGKKVVAYVGNLVDVKNVILLPKIFKEVASKRDDIVFWIVGDGIERKQLEEDTSCLNIQCKFWGNQKTELMPDIMNCIDVLVLPSKNESFGMVLVEAIACGANCVGSNVGGIPEVIGNENCFDLGESFIKNITRRINEMLDSKVFQSVKTDFDWNLTADKELYIYNQIIRNR